MGRATFEAYGKLANQLADHTVLAARHSTQVEAERRIVPDLIVKLNPNPTDSLLEIGCGAGNLLIPLSFLVERCGAMDHPDVLKALQKRFISQNLELYAGNFLDAKPTREFDIILIYSVLHCLANENEVFDFVQRAMSLLRPKGRLLLGDLPNRDLKDRFLSTEDGREFERRWREEISANNAFDEIQEFWSKVDDEMVAFDDRLIAALIDCAETHGCEATRLSQPPELPFGNTREDLLICRA